MGKSDVGVAKKHAMLDPALGRLRRVRDAIFKTNQLIFHDVCVARV